MNRFFYYGFVLLIASCDSGNRQPANSPVSLFENKYDTLQKTQNNFNGDDFGVIEGIQCNDSSLIAFDYHSGKCFSLFSLSSHHLISRFGAIGQGPGEILLGSCGFISGNSYYIFYHYTGHIAQYNIDSLYSGKRSLAKTLAKYEIPDAFFSQLIPVSDSLYFSAGAYKGKYQFVLFNSKSEVIDCSMEIYNSKENGHPINKNMANQGKLRKHPSENKFIYVLDFSSNMDLAEVVDNRINLIKSFRFRDPKNTPVNAENTFQVIPDLQSPVGYLDIATGDKYIYALYTDKKIIDDSGNASTYSSKEILVFDWSGAPVKKYLLQEEACYIAVSEKNGAIYTASNRGDEGWKIDTYAM